MLENISGSTSDLRYGTFNEVHRDQYNLAFGPPDKMETGQSMQDSAVLVSAHLDLTPSELKHLLRASSLDASCDSARRHAYPRCFEGTRVEILSALSAWSLDPSTPSICLLLGKHMSGKSAIAQTFSESCHSAGTLGGSFFLSPHIENCSSIERVFPTIASQLIISVPALKPVILDALRHDPLLTTKTAPKQLQDLVIGPFRTLDSESGAKSMIVVIDGLDECKDAKAVTELIFMLATKLKDPPISLKFLITSRPVPHVEAAFTSSIVKENVEVVNLDDFDAHKDISFYLLNRLEEICIRYNISGWPAERETEILASKAAGSFEAANRMLGYIESDGAHIIQKIKEVLKWKQGHPPHPSLLSRFMNHWDNDMTETQREVVKGSVYGALMVDTFCALLVTGNLALAVIYGFGFLIATFTVIAAIYGTVWLFVKSLDYLFGSVRKIVTFAWKSPNSLF